MHHLETICTAFHCAHWRYFTVSRLPFFRLLYEGLQSKMYCKKLFEEENKMFGIRELCALCWGVNKLGLLSKDAEGCATCLWHGLCGLVPQSTGNTRKYIKVKTSTQKVSTWWLKLGMYRMWVACYWFKSFKARGASKPGGKCSVFLREA